MSYEWEEDLAPYTSQTNIKKLCQLVKSKARKGQIAKWLIILADIVFIALLIIFIGCLNLLKIAMDLRISLINGIIAFELAVVTFLSPIRGSTIKRNKVDLIVGKQVTGDIMEKIRKIVEQKASGIQKWLAFIGACGILAALIFKIAS